MTVVLHAYEEWGDDQLIFLQLGKLAGSVSAFLRVSKSFNYETILMETMGLGTALTVVVDTNDFPPEFAHEELILKTSMDPSRIASEIRGLFGNQARCLSMVSAARKMLKPIIQQCRCGNTASGC